MPGKRKFSTEQSTPITLSAFHSEAKLYGKIFREKEPHLVDASNLFAEEEHMRPVEFRRLTILLELLSQPVRDFCKLLGNPALLPEAAVPHRYLLLATLQHMNEQIKALLQLIAAFRTAGQKSSKQGVMLRYDIQRKFALLLQDWTIVPQHVQDLSDKARFEEKKMRQLTVVKQTIESSQVVNLYDCGQYRLESDTDAIPSVV